MKNIDKRIVEINRRIRDIKEGLVTIEDMRPGSLTKQYRNPKKKKGEYYQISYTYKMKSKTEYVRKEFIDKLQSEIQSFKKFKQLISEWKELSIEKSKLSILLSLGKKLENENLDDGETR
ncbi:MAG: hypothetical protein K8S23_12235 [Candidatus Cloacimonetes bacterium]|nr:hypothetical protein [Candidatus Cloacimonadota bacterium]